MSRIEETINDSQLIIECVVEDFEVKSDLLEKISLMCPSDCIIVSTTLRLDIGKLAEKIKQKERFIGLRFLYPVYYIPEVIFKLKIFFSFSHVLSVLYFFSRL